MPVKFGGRKFMVAIDVTYPSHTFTKSLFLKIGKDETTAGNPTAVLNFENTVVRWETYNPGEQLPQSTNLEVPMELAKELYDRLKEIMEPPGRIISDTVDLQHKIEKLTLLNKSHQELITELRERINDLRAVAFQMNGIIVRKDRPKSEDTFRTLSAMADRVMDHRLAEEMFQSLSGRFGAGTAGAGTAAAPQTEPMSGPPIYYPNPEASVEFRSLDREAGGDSSLT